MIIFRVYFVTENEWHFIRHAFIVDETIGVKIAVEVKHEGPITRSIRTLVSTPEVCYECLQLRLENEEKARLVYQRKHIFVKKVSEASQESVEAASSTNANDEDHKGPFEDDFAKALMNGEPAHKKKKVSEILESAAGVLRRSSRKQKPRDGLENQHRFTVDSTMLLRDLRTAIMDAFKVATFDQALTLGGVALNGNKKTLGELKVSPGAVVILTENVGQNGENGDESGESNGSHNGTGGAVNNREEGFQGTGLISED